MAWLRLDDSFASHPKITELSEVDAWRWLSLLLTSVRHRRTGGRVTLRALQRHRLGPDRLVELGLLEVTGDGEYQIHDWDEYNAADNPAADRQKRYRMRRAGVPENIVLEVAPPRGDGSRSYEELRNRAASGAMRDVTRDVTDGVGVSVAAMSVVGPSPHARVPSNTKTLNTNPTTTRNPRKGGRERAREDRASPSYPPSPELRQATREHAADVERLVSLMPADDVTRDHVRGVASVSSAESVAAATAAVGAGVPDPVGRALAILEAGRQAGAEHATTGTGG